MGAGSRIAIRSSPCCAVPSVVVCRRGSSHPLRMLRAVSGAVELTSGTTWHRRWYPRDPGWCDSAPERCADAPATASPRRDRYDVRTMSETTPEPTTRPAGAPPIDRLGRQPRDLRISVTDRCNFRCTYCMPAEIFGRDYAFLPRSQILTFEEIVRLAGIFVRLGVEKLRITGGEPTVRRDLPDLVRQLAAIDGVHDLTLTTNGSALRTLAAPLAEAGLRRITVSLDSLDDAVFRAMSGADMPVARRARRDRGSPRGRPRADQGQHGRQARQQRCLDRPDGTLGARRGRHPPLHRVHGRGDLERLAAGRRRPAGGDRLDSSTRHSRSRRSRPTTRARSPRASATATGPARSA